MEEKKVNGLWEEETPVFVEEDEFAGTEEPKDDEKFLKDVWFFLKPILIGTVAGAFSYAICSGRQQKIHQLECKKKYELGYNVAKWEDSCYIDGIERGVSLATGTTTNKQ